MSFFPQKSGAEIIDRIAAQIGDVIITLHDIETFAPGIVRSINNDSDPEKRKAMWNRYYNETLELMIQNTTIQIAAARMGQIVTEQQIDEVLLRMQEQNSLFRARVREIMDREGKITPELRMEAKNELLREKVQAILFPRIVVTEEDVRNYLKNDPNVNFGQTEYNLELVLLPGRTSYNNFSNAMKKGGFEDAAAEVSQPIIKMGWINPDELVPEMRDAVKQLSPGELSKAVSDSDGRYAVLMLRDIRNESNVTDSLKKSVINKIQMEQIETVFKNWIERNKRSILVNRYNL
ncbi:MAG: peptidylprolyl isomerase [Deferribacteraceae bacterium]|jgi:parvulin-like peptidyl-prolyl isomerase|nr:peptidylprolyl isomerase [Deferribacteraceae bacterium]